MNTSNERERDLSSSFKSNAVCVAIDAEHVSSLGGVILNIICGFSLINKYMNSYSLVSHIMLLHILLQKVLLPLQVMIN